MADFYGTLLSTSFKVKDDYAFLADPQVQALKKHATSEGGFFEKNDVDKDWSFGWDGQYPSVDLHVYDDTDDNGDPAELNIADVLQPHLLPDEFVVIDVSGHEKLRHSGGYRTFVTDKGACALSHGVAWYESETKAHIVEELTETLKNLEAL